MRFAGSALAMIFFLCSTVVADENEELSKATKKTSALESYSFSMFIEIEGSPMPMDPFEFEGKNQGDILYLSGDMMGQEFQESSGRRSSSHFIGSTALATWTLAGPDSV